MVKSDYPCVGKWVGPKGCANVALIATDWIITAKHVVQNKINCPGIDVEVRFFDRDGNVSTAKVEKAFARQDAGPNFWEIAIARLDHPVENIPFVALAENALPPGREIEIAIVANELIAPAYCGRRKNGHLAQSPTRQSQTGYERE